MLIQTILKLKESQNLTYRGLGKKLGFSHTWLNEVVNGKKEPNLDLLRAVSVETGKGYNELMEVYNPIEEGATVDIQLLRNLFERSVKNQRHIRILRNRPSFVEQAVIDSIKSTTDFEFTNVTLNRNNPMLRHRHRNVGDSMGMLLGDFTGGALATDENGRFTEKNKWFKFNGKVNHWVEPFQGERYSIVIYKR